MCMSGLLLRVVEGDMQRQAGRIPLCCPWLPQVMHGHSWANEGQALKGRDDIPGQSVGLGFIYSIFLISSTFGLIAVMATLARCVLDYWSKVMLHLPFPHEPSAANPHMLELDLYSYCHTLCWIIWNHKLQRGVQAWAWPQVNFSERWCSFVFETQFPW